MTRDELEMDRLRVQVARLTRERDLAVAHDTQPYPTAEAYERVCAVLEKTKSEVARLKAERERVIFERKSDLDLAEKAVAVGKAARDQRNEASAEGLILRRMLWLRHGCDGLYGDDGEMQCGRCLLDFKRQPAAEIEARFQQAGLVALAAAAKARGGA